MQHQLAKEVSVIFLSFVEHPLGNLQSFIERFPSSGSDYDTDLPNQIVRC